ncbi:hypothetical protein K2173_012120 [Erythroxylum novogranatense]|uniref:Small auxin up regulated protein n=1 Tax=Erythroxylum novogranatense TaxID=1862640 RepID=A0AAV8SR32_9ROSI|nr:hypothetical protein K2173_012120 [Erythroxylum novogranatense]
MMYFKKLAKKLRARSRVGYERSREECLLKGYDEPPKTPTGFFVIYVGYERERFVVPTNFLSHPLFKMLLEKAHDDFDLHQNVNRLVVPCSVSTFQEVVSAVESCNGRFDVRNFIEELI